MYIYVYAKIKNTYIEQHIQRQIHKNIYIYMYIHVLVPKHIPQTSGLHFAREQLRLYLVIRYICTYGAHIFSGFSAAYFNQRTVGCLACIFNPSKFQSKGLHHACEFPKTKYIQLFFFIDSIFSLIILKAKVHMPVFFSLCKEHANSFVLTAFLML